MKTRRSARNQNIMFNALFKPAPPPPAAPPVRPRYLDMTDAEIDAAYSFVGKADRTRMKKAAAHERLRIEVKEKLSKDEGGKDVG